MLNWIWAGMVAIGIVYSAFTGNLGSISETVTESAKDAVTLSITMLGVLTMWSGFMELAKEGGMLALITRFLSPVIGWLFPVAGKDEEAVENITTNFAANILGLGNAALPAGLAAMKSLQRLNGNQSVASVDMCTFLIINISSLQLLPINLIAYRSQYGSVNPALITGPAFLATLVSTAAAVVFVFMMRLIRR